MNTTSNRIPEAGSGIRHSRVAAALRLIEEQGTSPIKVAELVNISGLSRRGLHKAFVRHTGRRPGQALRLARMERSEKMLLESRAAVGDIALLCGYSKVNSFNIAFKKHSGMPPSKFRQKFTKQK